MMSDEYDTAKIDYIFINNCGVYAWVVLNCNATMMVDKMCLLQIDSGEMPSGYCND